MVMQFLEWLDEEGVEVTDYLPEGVQRDQLLTIIHHHPQKLPIGN